jgi:hypothetical protein
MTLPDRLRDLTSTLNHQVCRQEVQSLSGDDLDENCYLLVTDRATIFQACAENARASRAA